MSAGRYFSSVVVISSTHYGIVAAYGHRPAEMIALCAIIGVERSGCGQQPHSDSLAAAASAM